MPAFWYTAVLNILDYPTGSIPSGYKVKAEDLEEEYGSILISRYNDPKYPNDNMVRVARETLKGSAGLPLNIQVSTLPFHEEECLGIMKVIDEVLNKK